MKQAQQNEIATLVEKLTLPEARQLLAALMRPDEYFEIPVGIREFVEHPDYLDRTNTYPSVMRDLEAIFAEDLDKHGIPVTGNFAIREAALLKGIGSGKSYETAICAVYMTYRMLCFKNPQKRFGLDDSTKAAYMVVAPTARLAKDIVFGYCSLFVGRSPWYRTYYPPDPTINSVLRFDPQPEDDSGKPIEELNARPYKNLAIIPGNSSENSALGYALYGAAIDEANFWETYENLKNGTNERTDEMFTRLQRRISSRFGYDWGLLSVISSSEQDDDFVEKKLIQARDNPSIYAVRLSIWEAKPKGTYSSETFELKTKLHGEDVTLHIPIDLRQAFRDDILRSLRDWASIPVGAENNYLNPSSVELASKRGVLPNPVKKSDAFGYIVEFADHMKKPAPYMAVISTDLSISRDSCGMAMSHWDPLHNRMTTPFLWQIRCTKENPLDYEEVRKTIQALRDFGWNFHLATFDNFQSTDMMQQLESSGIPTEKVSVDANTIPYDTLSGYLLENMLSWYPHPTAVNELKKLVLIRGKKVDHPKAASKDVADALAQNAFIIGRDLRAMTSVGTDPGDKYSTGGTGGPGMAW